MPILFFLFLDTATAAPVNPWTVIVPVLCSLLTAAITYAGMRRKNGGDAWKSLTEACAMLAKELKAALDEIPTFRHKIQTLEREKDQHAKQSAKWEAIAIARRDFILALQTDAALIVEDISHLTFITAGPVSDEDEKAMRRLKNIRDTGKRIAGLDCNLEEPAAIIVETQHYENSTNPD